MCPGLVSHFLCPCWHQQKFSHSRPHLDCVWFRCGPQIPPLASPLSVHKPDSMTSHPGSPHPVPSPQLLISANPLPRLPLTPPTETPTSLPPLFFPMDCLGPLEKSPETHYFTVRLSSIVSENHTVRSYPPASPTTQQDHIFCSKDTVSPLDTTSPTWHLLITALLSLLLLVSWESSLKVPSSIWTFSFFFPYIFSYSFSSLTKSYQCPPAGQVS